jgi:hypothetical protein
MAVELKNIVVKYISLVGKAANKRQFIYKSADKDEPTVEREIKIAKYDDEKGLVYGIVYAPDDLDTDQEFATSETIEKAAYQFMADLSLHNVDAQHDFQKRDAVVVESWLTKAGDPLFPDDPPGSWAVGIKVNDEALKADIRDGKVKGLSMAGTADKATTKAATFNESRAIDDMWTLTSALERVVRSIVDDEAVEDKAAVISDNVDQFKAALLEKFKLTNKAEKPAGLFRRLTGMIYKTQKTGVETMEEKDVKNLVSETVEKAVKDLPTPITKEELTEGVKTVVEKAVKPIVERIEALEKASPGSKQKPDADGDDSDDWAELGDEIAKSVNG